MLFSPWNIRRLALYAIVSILVLPCARAERLRSALPDDTALVIQIPDVPELVRSLQSSPLGRFYADPAAQGFFEPLRRRLHKARLLLDPAGDIPDRDLLALLSGELVIAGLPADGSAPGLEWAVLFEHASDERLKARLRQGFITERGTVTRSQSSFQGTSFEELRVVRDEEAVIPIGKSRTGAQRITANPLGTQRKIVEQVYEHTGDGYFIHVSGKRGWMEGILRRLATGDEEFTPPRLEAAGVGAQIPALVSVYANGPSLTRLGRRLWAKENPGLDVEPLRLEELRSIVAEVRIDEECVRLDGALHSPEPRKGVARLLFISDGKAESMADRVPATAAFYSESQYPLAEAWDIAWTLLAQVAPDLHRAIDAQLQGVSLRSGVDFRQDLIGRLGDQVVRCVPVADMADAPAVYLLRVKEGNLLGPALQRFLTSGAEAYGAFFVEQADMGSRPLVTFNTGRPDVGVAQAARPVFHFTWEDDLLAFCFDGVSLAREMQRWSQNDGNSLSESSEMEKARQSLTLPAAFGFDFTRLPGIVQLLDDGIPRPAGSRGGLAAMDRQLVNEKAVPTESVWSQYVGPIASARKIEGDRLLFQGALLFERRDVAGQLSADSQHEN